ncbi:GNAT family N-acetyltransferase [Microbacterium oxydans]|uniref:GNAT family N-acetyltransferase n=1 Tax=Microbacterium oxydans TaxID=82380 RepID=UPI00364499EF
MSITDIEFRHPGAGESDAISALARRSKAHWGYSAEFMASCRDELTFTVEQCVSANIWVAARGDDVLGFYLLTGDGAVGELAAMFVEPAHIGTGVGRALLRHARGQADARGIRQLYVDADPHSEDFYAHHGARRVGDTPSGSIPGRVLPRMVFTGVGRRGD